MNPRPFQILILSANRVQLRRLSKFLDVFGYEVRQAASAPEAIAAAEAARPDFLIVDGSQPKGADLGLCRTVRRLWPQCYVYSLLMSQLAEVSDVTAALEAGFDDFLASPVVFGELLARLRVGARFIEFERRIGEHSESDPLTGLADRAALKRELNRRSTGSKEAIVWLALVDLDDFSRVAARLGRSGAQDLLRQIGQNLREEAGEINFVAGLSEGRFAMLVTASGNNSAAGWSQALLAGLAETDFQVAGNTQKVTASCGLTKVTAGENYDAVESRSLRALSLAKISGRNCLVTSDDVDRDAAEWAEQAADGKLFQTTLARDVMHFCPMVMHLDETLEQSHWLLSQQGLEHAPVVDSEKRLVGLISLDQITAAQLRSPRPRTDGIGGSSVRLVRHVMNKEVARFDVDSPLADLIEYFTGESSSVVVIVRDREPLGLVYCHLLASLNERLNADYFAAHQTSSFGSADLLVPDTAVAE